MYARMDGWMHACMYACMWMDGCSMDGCLSVCIYHHTLDVTCVKEISPIFKNLRRTRRKFMSGCVQGLHRLLMIVESDIAVHLTSIFYIGRVCQT